MFDVILVIHKNMTTTSGTHLQGLHSTQERHHTHIDMLHVVSVLLIICAQSRSLSFLFFSELVCDLLPRNQC